jgi:hypothetical protein
LRTHIFFYGFGTTATTRVGFGLVVEDNGALPTAATADIFQNPNRDWYGLGVQYIAGSAATTTIQFTASRLYEYDFRSKRKLPELQSTAALYSVCDGAASVTMYCRTLLALP